MRKATSEKARPLSILVVEDDATDAATILGCLKQEGFDASHVRHVKQLDEVLSARCDVMILDLNLPDSSGMDTLRAARALLPEAVIVVITGSDRGNQGTEALSEGAQDYIVKGEYDAAALYKSIRYSIARKQLFDEGLAAGQARATAMVSTGVAHNLKNLLNALLMNLELCRDEVTEDGQDLLASAAESGQRINEVLDQLLHIGAEDELAKSRYDLAGVARQVVEQSRATLNGIELRYDGPTEELAVLGVDQHFRRALMNLILNSRDAIAERGTREGLIVVHVGEGPEGVEVEVSDNGSGMSADIRARATEAFFTTKPNDAGIGLGLTVAEDVAREHGGYIEIASTERYGTTVRMVFPSYN